jgi:hypothetical protein
LDGDGMKQYRIRTETRDDTVHWSEWRKLSEPLNDHEILTVQFNEALTVKESEEFFKHFVDGL